MIGQTAKFLEYFIDTNKKKKKELQIITLYQFIRCFIVKIE